MRFYADRSSDAADGRPRPQAAGGAKIGIIAVLHTWGQAMPHHPHVHCVVPGGGLSPDKSRWFACRPGFFLPVRILSRVFRRLFAITHAFAQGELRFSNRLAHLKDPAAFTCHLAHAAAKWVVYAKPPFGWPDQVLAPHALHITCRLSGHLGARSLLTNRELETPTSVPIARTGATTPGIPLTKAYRNSLPSVAGHADTGNASIPSSLPKPQYLHSAKQSAPSFNPAYMRSAECAATVATDLP